MLLARTVDEVWSHFVQLALPYSVNTLSQKTSHLWLQIQICYNLDIHSSIIIIVGTNVTEKVHNQNVLYFPTSPN